MRPGFEHALMVLGDEPAGALLDVGCGAGMFCEMAHTRGHTVTGIDLSPGMLELARSRTPGDFLGTDMAQLPFADQSFDVVTGFNAFQFAGDPYTAFTEAHRVLKPGGRLFVLAFGKREACEGRVPMMAVSSLLPAVPRDWPGPFRFAREGVLTELLDGVGFEREITDTVDVTWDYPNVATFQRAMLASGNQARACEVVGSDIVATTLAAAVAPYVQPNGRVRLRNEFQYVLARKQGQGTTAG